MTTQQFLKWVMEQFPRTRIYSTLEVPTGNDQEPQTLLLFDSDDFEYKDDDETILYQIELITKKWQDTDGMSNIILSIFLDDLRDHIWWRR